MTDLTLSRLGFETDDPADITKDRWVQAQRDLITTTLDYNLQTIAGLVEDGRIDLSPVFQRRDRWDNKRKSLLIESFLMNVPLPPVFLNEDEYGQYSIIDGKQRLTTVSDFLSNKFKLEGLQIFTEANGLRFAELDHSLRSVLQTRASLRAIILLRMSDPQIKYHVFQRLNTGGVRLNSQEVRNVTFAGELNNEITEASSYQPFMHLIGLTPANKSRTALWQQMRDVELVLRYLTLRESWEDFSGSLGGAMNYFLGSNFHMTSAERNHRLNQFRDAVDKVGVVFDDLAFRRLDIENGTIRAGKQVLATLFDAQMIAVTAFAQDELHDRQAAIRQEMASLFEIEEFSKAISSQTNTPRFVKARITMVHDAILRAVS